jgi:hypothetical protein
MGSQHKNRASQNVFQSRTRRRPAAQLGRLMARPSKRLRIRDECRVCLHFCTPRLRSESAARTALRPDCESARRKEPGAESCPSRDARTTPGSLRRISHGADIVPPRLQPSRGSSVLCAFKKHKAVDHFSLLPGLKVSILLATVAADIVPRLAVWRTRASCFPERSIPSH